MSREEILAELRSLAGPMQDYVDGEKESMYLTIDVQLEWEQVEQFGVMLINLAATHKMEART